MLDHGDEINTDAYTKWMNFGQLLLVLLPLGLVAWAAIVYYFATLLLAG